MRNNRLPEQGQPITAQFISDMVRQIFGRIRGGKGIRITWLNDNCVIERDSVTKGASGGGGVPMWLPYEGED